MPSLTAETKPLGEAPDFRPTNTRIEWVKVTVDTQTAGETVVHTFAEIRKCGGVIGGGPFGNVIDNDARTITFELLTDIDDGIYFLGLVEDLQAA